MNLVELFGLDSESFLWQDFAMCHGLPFEMFFEAAESNTFIEKSVKDVCDYCPVKSICLDEGQSNKEFGIWGGEKLERGKINE